MKTPVRAGIAAAAATAALALTVAPAANAASPPRITNATLSAPFGSNGQQNLYLSFTEKPVNGHRATYTVTMSGTATFIFQGVCGITDIETDPVSASMTDLGPYTASKAMVTVIGALVQSAPWAQPHSLPCLGQGSMLFESTSQTATITSNTGQTATVSTSGSCAGGACGIRQPSSAARRALH